MEEKKYKNCAICTGTPMGMSPEGWNNLQAWHDNGHPDNQVRVTTTGTFLPPKPNTIEELGEPINFDCGCKNMSIKARLEGKELEINKFCTIHNSKYTTEEWEKEFDNFFHVRTFNENEGSWNPPSLFVMKEFIRQHLSSAKQEERERMLNKLESLRKETKGEKHPNPIYDSLYCKGCGMYMTDERCDDCYTFNETLSTLIITLKGE